MESQFRDIQLPPPAIKCVIGQYLEIFADRSWAWFVTGSFYDESDTELWHIEVILGRKPRTTQSQSTQNFINNTSGMLLIASCESFLLLVAI